MTARNSPENRMTEEEIVAAVLRMRPAVRRRVLARLLRASSAAARGLVATPRRRRRSADDEFREALAASAGILKLDEDVELDGLGVAGVAARVGAGRRAC